MRMIGQGKEADELVEAMNHAAEQAVPEAKELLVNAVKTMSLGDAKAILTGGDGSVTNFFRTKTAAPLAVKFLPIVKQATDRVGLARKYAERRQKAVARPRIHSPPDRSECSVRSWIIRRGSPVKSTEDVRVVIQAQGRTISSRKLRESHACRSPANQVPMDATRPARS
jgi:hypothetical protein